MGIFKHIIFHGTTIVFVFATVNGLNELGVQQHHHHKHGEETPPRYEERIHYDAGYVLSGSTASFSEATPSKFKASRWSIIDADAGT